MPRFSIIIQSYLGYYDRAASNREEKIIRSINSAFNQSFNDLEVIVVADGCEKTFDIICGNYLGRENINCLLIPKQPIWSGFARNVGIENATGDIIIYLDIDDYLGENHLKKINDQFGDNDWVWFNDHVIDPRSMKPIERTAIIDKKFGNGTANIAHKRTLPVRWTGTGYGNDDWSIVQNLLAYSKHKQINTPEYYVCHLPGRLDV